MLRCQIHLHLCFVGSVAVTGTSAHPLDERNTNNDPNHSVIVPMNVQITNYPKNPFMISITNGPHTLPYTVTINPHNGPWCLVGPKVFYVRQTQVITGPILGWLAAGSKVTIFDWDDTKLCEKKNRGRKTMENWWSLAGHIWKTGFILENDG